MATPDHSASKGETAKDIFPLFSLSAELRNQIHAEATTGLWIKFPYSRSEHRHCARLKSALCPHPMLISRTFKQQYEAEIAREAPHAQLRMELYVVPYLCASSLRMALKRVRRVELTHQTPWMFPFDDWLAMVQRKVNDGLSDFKRLVGCGVLPSLKQLELIFLSSRVDIPVPIFGAWYRPLDFEPDKVRDLLDNVARLLPPNSVELSCSVMLNGWLYAPEVYKTIFPAVTADTV